MSKLTGLFIQHHKHTHTHAGHEAARKVCGAVHFHKLCTCMRCRCVCARVPMHYMCRRVPTYMVGVCVVLARFFMCARGGVHVVMCTRYATYASTPIATTTPSARGHQAAVAVTSHHSVPRTCR
eukprot:comp13370_c0_seq1/m.8841 comp13370_c0_seq1/g.8841  ORF comp13370_c0_seq1/g.8841 comp13370_c0_seq1/m.8841 type:complete len:124 (+) comp13370_c0_seq1:389-760(+)